MHHEARYWPGLKQAVLLFLGGGFGGFDICAKNAFMLLGVKREMRQQWSLAETTEPQVDKHITVGRVASD